MIEIRISAGKAERLGLPELPGEGVRARTEPGMLQDESRTFAPHLQPGSPAFVLPLVHAVAKIPARGRQDKEQSREEETGGKQGGSQGRHFAFSGVNAPGEQQGTGNSGEDGAARGGKHNRSGCEYGGGRVQSFPERRGIPPRRRHGEKQYGNKIGGEIERVAHGGRRPRDAAEIFDRVKFPIEKRIDAEILKNSVERCGGAAADNAAEQRTDPARRGRGGADDGCSENKNGGLLDQSEAAPRDSAEGKSELAGGGG